MKNFITEDDLIIAINDHSDWPVEFSWTKINYDDLISTINFNHIYNPYELYGTVTYDNGYYRTTNEDGSTNGTVGNYNGILTQIYSSTDYDIPAYDAVLDLLSDNSSL